MEFSLAGKKGEKEQSKKDQVGQAKGGGTGEKGVVSESSGFTSLRKKAQKAGDLDYLCAKRK